MCQGKLLLLHFLLKYKYFDSLFFIFSFQWLEFSHWIEILKIQDWRQWGISAKFVSFFCTNAIPFSPLFQSAWHEKRNYKYNLWINTKIKHYPRLVPPTSLKIHLKWKPKSTRMANTHKAWSCCLLFIFPINTFYHFKRRSGTKQRISIFNTFSPTALSSAPEREHDFAVPKIMFSISIWRTMKTKNDIKINERRLM